MRSLEDFGWLYNDEYNDNFSLKLVMMRFMREVSLIAIVSDAFVTNNSYL